MFFRRKPNTLLRARMTQLIDDFLAERITKDEFDKQADRLLRADRLQRNMTGADGFSKDQLLAVGANLLGIFMIIKHESVNVITSKALGFVMKTRI